MNSCIINTPLGKATILGDENGISAVTIAGEDKFVSDQIPESLKECVNQLEDYFAGDRSEFDLNLNPKGTEFQKKVWRYLQDIPYGKSMSYLELAKQLGDPKAIRAVASANGKNPLWIIVPCHRVIGSDGSLVGYAGGLGRKKWLLNHESAVKQQTLF